MNTFKKALLSTLLISTLVPLQAAPNQPSTIILWDIHQVILTKEKMRMIKQVLSLMIRRGILKKASFRLMRDFYKLSQKKEKTAEAFVEIARKHGNHELANMIIRIANTQEPIEGTVAILRELKQNGYANHIGSNIGPTVFEDLKRSKPRVFNNHLFDLDKSQLACYKDGALLAKPDKAFFEQYLQKNNLDPRNTKIIFVDDKYENTCAAQAVGLVGIHFKNPQQLRCELIAQGVNIRAC